MKRIVYLIIVIVSNTVWSQTDANLNFPPPDNPVEIKVEKAADRITIDGELIEPSWQNAAIIDDFFRREPRQGGDIKYKTQVRFLYDDKNLYVSAICSDSCLLYTSPSPRDGATARMPSSA